MQVWKKIKLLFSFYFGLPVYFIRGSISVTLFSVVYLHFATLDWISCSVLYLPFYLTKVVLLNLFNFILSFEDTYYIYKFSIYLIYFIIKILIFHPLSSLLLLILLFCHWLNLFIFFNFYKIKLLLKFLYLFFITYDFSSKLVTIVTTVTFLCKQIFVTIFCNFCSWIDSHIFTLLADISPILVESYALFHDTRVWAETVYLSFYPGRLHDRDLILKFSNQYLTGNYYLDELRVWVQYLVDIPYCEKYYDLVRPDPNAPVKVELGFLEKWIIITLSFFFWSCIIGLICAMFFFLTSKPHNIHCDLWYNITWRIMLFIFVLALFVEIIVFTIDLNSIIKVDLHDEFLYYRNINFNAKFKIYDILIWHMLPHWAMLIFLLVTWYLMKKNYNNNFIFFAIYNLIISAYYVFFVDLQYEQILVRGRWLFWVSADRIVKYYYIFKHPGSIFQSFTTFDYIFLPFILFAIWYIYYLCTLMWGCWPIFYKNILRPIVKTISRNTSAMLALFGRSFVDEDDYIERTMESELNSWLGVVIRRSNIENKLEWDEFVEIDAFIINFYLTAWTFAYEEKLRRIENYMLENLDLTRIWQPVFDSTKFKYPLKPNAETILIIREKIYDMGEEEFYKLTVQSYWSLFVSESDVNIDDVKFYDITNEPQRNMNDSALTWDEERHPYHYGCNVLRITGQGFHEQIQSFTYKEYGEISQNIMTYRILYGEPGYIENPDVIIDELFPLHEKLYDIECFCEQDEIDLKNKIKEMQNNEILRSRWPDVKINWDFIDGITTKSPKFKPLVQDFEPELECKTDFAKEREGFLRIRLITPQEISVRALIPTKQEALKAPWLVIGGLWYRTNNYYGISTTIPLFEIAVGKDKLLVLQNVDAIRKQLFLNKEFNKELFDTLNIWVKKEVYLKEENLTTAIQDMPFFLRRENISRTPEEWLEWQRKIHTPESFKNYFDKSKKNPLQITFIPIRYEKIKDFDYYDDVVPDPREEIYKKNKKKKNKKKKNLFKERKFMKYKRLQKFRQKNIYYNFLHFKMKSVLKMCSILYSLNNVKIFPFHLKLFRFFFNRFRSKTKHVSRRERFKRANKKSSSLESLKLEKKGFYYNKFIEGVT